MALTTIEFGPYTEGVNLVDPPVKLSPNELSKCLNFRTGPRGDFYKRPGHDWYGLNSGATGRINGDVLTNFVLRYYKSDGTKELLAAAGGKFRKGDEATGLWTDISINGTAASMGASLLADGIVYKNRVYVADGTRPHRYNGINDLYVGYFSHAAPVAVGAAGGGLTALATYKYRVTSVAGDLGEGPAGDVATITLAAGQTRVNLSAMADAPAVHEETHKRVYRTVGNGVVYYLLAELLVGTTVLVDLTSDATLILGSAHVPVHVPPSESRFVIMGHDDRAYWFGRTGVNASIVEVSDVGFPDRILDAVGFFAVSNNDGDLVTGGGLTPGGVVFFKKTSLWLLRAFGFGLINIYPKEKRGSGVGTTSPFSIVTTPVGMIFLSQRGEVYLFDGTNLKEIGRKVASEFRNMTSDSMGRVVACYHDYRYQISYDWRSSKGYNWRTLEFDTLTGKWEGPYENGDFFNPSYYSVWDSVLDVGELAWGEAKAANGSRVYVRSEFTKTDRGTKFISTGASGAVTPAKLGDVKITKIFIHGDFSADALLFATHIDEAKNRVQIILGTSISYTRAIYNSTKYNDGSKYAGYVAQVLSGTFGPSVRSKTPTLEFSDGGTATDARVNIIQALAELISLK